MERLFVFTRSPILRWAALVIVVLSSVVFNAKAPTSSAQVGVDSTPAPKVSPDNANKIGPDGGQVSSPDGRVRVIIPKGVLTEPTQVLLGITPGYDERTSFDFDLALGPKSAEAPLPKFMSPATVELTPTTQDVSRLGANAVDLGLKQLDFNTGVTVQTAATVNASKSSYTAQIAEPGHFILATNVPKDPVRADASVTPEAGGSLLAPKGDVRVDFPAGSVSENVKAEYRVPDVFRPMPFQALGQFDLNAYAVDRQNAPANQFSKALTVTVAPSPAAMARWNPESLTLYWLNEQTIGWERVPDQSVNAGVITAAINHFSTYSYGAMPNVAGPGINLHHQVDMHAGSANMDIPVEVSPGPGGFLPPSLVLSYTSSSVNEMKSTYSMGGALGIGWDLRLPSIVRDPGAGDPANPQERYFLQLDGITDELIRVTNPPAPEGQWNYWATKNERYLRIASRVLGGTNALFTVDAKDGTTYYFGTVPNPGCCGENTALQRWYWQNFSGTWYKQFYRFDLGRVKDTHGNYADYTYVRETYDPCACGKTSVRSAYLDKIDWGGNLTSGHPHRFRISTSLNDPTNQPRIDAPVCAGKPIPAVYESRFYTEIRVQVLNETSGLPDIQRKYALVYYPQTGPNCAGQPSSGTLKLWGAHEYGKQLYEASQGARLKEMGFSYQDQTFAFRILNAQLGTPQDCAPTTTFTRPFLQQATNGLGGTVSFGYETKWQQGAPWTDTAGACNLLSTSGCPTPIVLPCGSMPTWSRVVSTSKTDNAGVFTGVSPNVTHTYSYGDGPKHWVNTNPQFRDPIDADFRGFRDVTETDLANAYRKCWYFTTGWEPEIGMPADILTGHDFKCQWFNPGGGQYLQSVHPFWFWRAGAAAGSNFVYKSTQDTYGLHAGCYCENWSFDAYGNETGYGESQIGLYRSKSTEYYPNTTLWIVDLPASETVSDSNGTLSRDEYHYDSNSAHNQIPVKGDLTSTWRNIDASTVRKQESTVYDAFGNPEERTKWREGSAVLSTALDYHYHYKNYLMSESQAIAGGATLTESYVYDTLLGARTQVTDANGQVSKFLYDDFGRVTGEWEPDEVSSFPNNPTVQYSYFWSGVAPNRTITYQREVTGSAGQLVTSVVSDGLARQIQQRSEIDANNCTESITKMSVTDTKYDNVGRVQLESIPYSWQSGAGDCSSFTQYSSPASASQTSYEYDGLGRETKITNPDGNFRRMYYGTANGTTTTIDEKLHKMDRIEDAFGRLTATKEYLLSNPDPDWQYFVLYTHTKNTYDSLDRVTSVTEGEGTTPPNPENITTFRYNMLGRDQMVDPDMGTWSYSYYDDGLLRTQTDARGVTEADSYDGLDRTTSRTFTGYVGTGPSSPVTYTYDTCQLDCAYDYPKGQLTSVSDFAGTHLYNYDIRGRLDHERHHVPAGVAALNVKHWFDSMNREFKTTYPDGQNLIRSFNPQGLANWMISGVYIILNSATYNAAGMPTQLGLGSNNALTVNYSYRPSDLRLERITASASSQTRLDLEYDYDARGNVLTVRDYLEDASPPTVATHNYDALDRLTSVTGIPNTTIAYGYSNIGNITSKVEGSSNYTSMTYPPDGSTRPHAIQSANPQSGGQHTFAYDVSGQPNNGNLVREQVSGGDLHAFEYDAAGMTFKRVSSSLDTKYYHGEAEALYRKVAPDQAADKGTVYIGGIYEKNLDTNAVTKYYFLNGQRIAMRDGALNSGSTFFFVGDHLGSTALITNSLGAETARMRYFPFGGIRSQTGTPNTDKLYTGQQQETANGIYHYGARLYNTDVARFPQADTFSMPTAGSQAISRYSYVQNNPTNFTDPTGHALWFGDGGGGKGSKSPTGGPKPPPPTYGGGPPPSPTPGQPNAHLKECGYGITWWLSWFDLYSRFSYDFQGISQDPPETKIDNSAAVYWDNVDKKNSEWTRTVHFADAWATGHWVPGAENNPIPGIAWTRRGHIWIQEDAWGNCTACWVLDRPLLPDKTRCEPIQGRVIY